MDNIDKYVSNFNNGLVGFHGLEYIIFREGKERSASDIPELEIKYAIAVSADLTLSACHLEAAWAGLDNVTEEKRAILEDAGEERFGEFGRQMKLSGQTGSLWTSVTAGSEQIIEGCKDIVDEVGKSKIGKPYTGEDENYIDRLHYFGFKAGVVPAASAVHDRAQRKLSRERKIALKCVSAVVGMCRLDRSFFLSRIIEPLHLVGIGVKNFSAAPFREIPALRARYAELKALRAESRRRGAFL